MAYHIFSYKYRYVLTTIMSAIVKPTISGETIERRDQVLIGRFSFFQWQAQPYSLDEDR